MWVTVILIVVIALKTASQGLENYQGGRDHPDHSIVKNQLEYSEESWKQEKTCCYLHSSESPPIRANQKNSQGVMIKRWGELEIRGRIKTFQTAAQLKAVRYIES